MRSPIQWWAGGGEGRLGFRLSLCCYAGSMCSELREYELVLLLLVLKWEGSVAGDD